MAFSWQFDSDFIIRNGSIISGNCPFALAMLHGTTHTHTLSWRKWKLPLPDFLLVRQRCMKRSSQTHSVVMSQHALEGACAIAAAQDQVTIWHLLARHHTTTHATPNLQKTYTLL